MNCSRTRSLLSAYIDSELTGQEMLLIRDHLSWCEGCRGERDSLLEIKSWLSALPTHAPRPELAVDISGMVVRHPLEIQARRFFRSLAPRNDSASNALSSMSIYGRRFAMAGALSLMSVWFIIAPSASESPTMQLASAAHSHHVGARLRGLVNSYNAAIAQRMFGSSDMASFSATAMPQMQQSSMMLNDPTATQLRSIPVVGAPPFGQGIYFGGFPSHTSSMGSFLYTGYSTASH